MDFGLGWVGVGCALFKFECMHTWCDTPDLLTDWLTDWTGRPLNIHSPSQPSQPLLVVLRCWVTSKCIGRYTLNFFQISWYSTLDAWCFATFLASQRTSSCAWCIYIDALHFLQLLQLPANTVDATIGTLSYILISCASLNATLSAFPLMLRSKLSPAQFPFTCYATVVRCGTLYTRNFLQLPHSMPRSYLPLFVFSIPQSMHTWFTWCFSLCPLHFSKASPHSSFHAHLMPRQYFTHAIHATRFKIISFQSPHKNFTVLFWVLTQHQ